MKSYKNDILEIFAIYKVFDVPDALISNLALYVSHEASLARDEVFRYQVDAIKRSREAWNEDA